MTIKTCCYVLTPASPGVNATYCNRPLGYTMKEDDDGRKVRKYNDFCFQHLEEIEAARKNDKNIDPDYDFDAT